MNFTFLSLKETKKEIVQHNTVMFILAENTAANSNKKLLLLFLFLFLSNGTWCLFPFHQSNRLLYQFFFFFSLLVADKGCGQNRIHISHSSSTPPWQRCALRMLDVLFPLQKTLPQEMIYDTKDSALPGEKVTKLARNEVSQEKIIVDIPLN